MVVVQTPCSDSAFTIWYALNLPRADPQKQSIRCFELKSTSTSLGDLFNFNF